MEKRLDAKAVLLAIFCNVLFGSASPAIKLGYELFEISGIAATILFAGIRFFTAGIFVFCVTAVKDRKLPKISRGNELPLLATALIYTFVQYIFYYVGLAHTTGANGSIISSSSAFFAVIFAHFLYKDDRLNLKKVIGSAVGFAGVLLICLSGGSGSQGFSFLGEGFILLTALSFTVGSLFNKKASAVDGSFNVTTYNLLIGGALLILVGVLGNPSPMKISAAGIGVLLYLSMVSATAFTIWSWLIRNYPIGKVSVFNFVIPVSGTILSSVVLGENILKWQFAAALLLVSFGIITVNAAKKKE